MLQARLEKADPRLYDVNRDVAHNFAFVVEEVARRLEDRRWHAMHTHLDATPEQLGEAAKCFILFVASAVQNPRELMVECLERSGFRKLPDTVQVSYMATLGAVMAGIYFQGCREATLGGTGPCSDLQGLVAAGRECHRLMSAPAWQRPWLRMTSRLRKALHAFTSTDGA